MFGKEFGRELVKPPKLTPKEVEQKLIIYLRESTNYLRVATGFAAGLGTEKPGVATPIIRMLSKQQCFGKVSLDFLAILP